MFPKKASDAYIKSTGERSTLGEVIGSGGGGGGGGSFTPDYENQELVIGIVDDFEYYIPMSKRFVGDGKHGYEIKTNPESSQYTAKIDIYSFIFVDGQTTDKTLIKTLAHNGESTYEDSNIKVEYVTADTNWKVTLITDMYETSDNDPVSSPVTWRYDSEVDYNWYML